MTCESPELSVVHDLTPNGVIGSVAMIMQSFHFTQLLEEWGK